MEYCFRFPTLAHAFKRCSVILNVYDPLKGDVKQLAEIITDYVLAWCFAGRLL